MAVIIPNSTDTTGGEEYASLDQAEPDSLDFEILGNVGRSGVLTGCEVTSNGTSTDVAVAAGTIVLNGVSYAVSADASLSLPAAPGAGLTRFDLIVARVSGGSASLTTVQGNASSTNPVFPQSMNVYGSTYDSSIHVKLDDQDVVLAAVLRVESSTVTSKEIADKRAVLTGGIMWRGTTLPTTGVKDGDFFLKTDEAAGTSGTSNSAFYFRVNSAWIELAQNTAVAVPIGGSIAWSGTSLPTGFLAEDGSSVARAIYPDLFAVIGYTYGGSGDNFNLPNSIGRMQRGSTVPNIGNTGGSDTVSVLVANMPVHSHSLANHSHTMAHTHSIDHDHASASTSSAPTHTHSINHDHASVTSGGGGSHTHQADPFFAALNTDWNVALSNATQIATSSSTGVYTLTFAGTPSYVGPLFNEFTDNSGDHIHSVNLPNYTGTSGSDGNHAHTVDLPNFIGTSGAASTSTTSTATGNTGDAGTGAPITVTNPYIDRQWIIRAY